VPGVRGQCVEGAHCLRLQGLDVSIHRPHVPLKHWVPVTQWHSIIP